MAREFSSQVRSGIRAQVVNNFDLGNITGLPALPTFTQNLIDSTPEPYVYFRSEQSLKADTSRDTSPREYATAIEVRESYPINSGGPHVVDQIADEIVGILETGVPTIEGGTAYIQVVEDVRKTMFKMEDKSYYQANITVLTHVQETLAPPPMGTDPIQTPTFVFNNFTVNPLSGRNNRIELFDRGSIVPTTVYPSNNNGFDFVSAAYSLAPGSDGSLSMGAVAVDADDVVSINSTLNYQSETDSTVTRTLSATTAFPRIRSFRFGVLQGTSLDLQNLSFATAARRGIEFGILSPAGRTVTFELMAQERGYIAYDASEDDLTAITASPFGNDITDQWTLTQSDGFKVYLMNDPFVFTSNFTVTLS